MELKFRLSISSSWPVNVALILIIASWRWFLCVLDRCMSHGRLEARNEATLLLHYKYEVEDFYFVTDSDHTARRLDDHRHWHRWQTWTTDTYSRRQTQKNSLKPITYVLISLPSTDAPKFPKFRPFSALYHLYTVGDFLFFLFFSIPDQLRLSRVWFIWACNSKRPWRRILRR